MTAEARENPQTYGIGAVAKLTGLTDHTIRVWERRYQAVVASRAANGRRTYTAADVEKLSLLKLLTDQGISISQIANNSTDELQSRAQSITNIASLPVPDEVVVAVLGDFLPARLMQYEQDLAPLKLVIADTDTTRFDADLSRHAIDVVIYETPVLNAETIARMRSMMENADAQRGVLLYSFGRTVDAERAADMDIVLLRSPASIDTLRASVLRAFAPRPRPARRPSSVDTGSPWEFSGTPAPRRFTQPQLARLANVSSTIECECPQHLAQLVADLNAFEVYSANCANRNDEDAALHRFLHQTTAHARAMIEGALERVARAEGIDY